MIDEVFKYLCSKMATEEWTGLDEINEIIRKYGLGQKEMEELMDFLKKYFLEVDESKQKMRLKSWTYDLLGISIQ